MDQPEDDQRSAISRGPGLLRSGPTSLLYSPKCVEGLYGKWFRRVLRYSTAVSKNFEPRGIIRKHESLLGRPQTEDSRRRETRRLQARDRHPVRGEPLLGQTLHQDGARGRLAGPEEAPGQTS